MYFIEEFARFISLRALSESSKTCYFHPVSTPTVVSDGLHEPYLLLTNSSFILILSDWPRGCLIWVKFVEIPKPAARGLRILLVFYQHPAISFYNKVSL